jgi:hypothetical protein
LGLVTQPEFNPNEHGAAANTVGSSVTKPGSHAHLEA